MAISLTETAAEHMRSFLQDRGGAFGIRLKVQPSGCSGLSYGMEVVDQAADERNDVFFEDKSIRLVVDRKSLVYLDGTEIDLKKEGLNEGFVFHNPNAKASCGCGESFTV